jgi:hypothetical protein
MTATAYATAPPRAPARRAGSQPPMPTTDIRTSYVPDDVLERIGPILERRRIGRSRFCIDIVIAYTEGDFDPNTVKLPKYLTAAQRDAYELKKIQYRLDDEAHQEFLDKVKANASNKDLDNEATGKPWTAAQIITAGMQMATYTRWRDLPF